MPYPNEHSARLQEPSKFNPDTFRRVNDGTIYGRIKVPATVAVIWGKLKKADKPADKPIPQALRFPTKNWTAEQARAWLKKNNVKYIRFEPASGGDSSSQAAVNVAATLAHLQDTKWVMEAAALCNLFSSVAAQESFLPTCVEISVKEHSLTVKGSEAVIPIKGVLMREIPKAFVFWGIEGTSYLTVQRQIKEALANDSVKSILLDVDSPGGAVPGVLETAELIRQARQKKPVRAFVDDLCASGAYWLASQANQIESVPNGEAGSIGVFTVYVDSSKRAEDMGFKVHLIRSGEHKGMGVPGVEISEAQVEAVQAIVDGIADNFIDSVSAGRKMKKTEVRQWADGRLWLADEAAKMGIIDNVTKPVTLESKSKKKQVQSKGKVMDNNDQDVLIAEEQTKAIETQKQAAVDSALSAERERIRQINAKFADDPAFANKAIAEGWELQQARAEYADVLQERLKEKEKNSQSSVDNNQSEGSEPLSSGDTDDGAGGDFLEQARAMAAEKKISVTDAMKRLQRARPGLHQAYLEKMRERGKEVYNEAV